MRFLILLLSLLAIVCPVHGERSPTVQWEEPFSPISAVDPISSSATGFSLGPDPDGGARRSICGGRRLLLNETSSDAAPLSGELRPVRKAFLFQRVAPGAAIILLITLVAAIVALVAGAGAGWAGAAALAGVLVAGLWVLLAGWWANVAYSKERYEFLEHRIIAHRGSPISDQTSELTIRNITHVKRRLPWPRYPLFGVGDVMIESAGSQASEITLRTIRHPGEVYDDVAALMRANGFHLAREELLHEEQPDTVAVILECAGMVAATIFATFVALAELYFDDGGPGGIGGYLGLLPLLGIVAVAFHFLDMRRRTYRVYSDSVFYEEGFLTRDDAFIPGENIADSSSRRGLIDMLVGVYDVQISCQGSQGEIHFRRLRGGPALSSAVERVITGTKELSGPAEEESQPSPASERGEQDRSPDVRRGKARPAAPPPESRWTSQLRPTPLRAVIVPIVLCVVAFPLLPVWILLIVRGLIIATCTTYSVRQTSVGERYQFLRSSEREFNYDKITGAVIRENPLDRLFGTVTVSIWSIGSGQPLNLAHVKRDQVQMDPLLRQLGIPEPDVVERLPARFSIRRMLMATLPGQVLLGIAVVVLLGLSLIVSAAWLLALVPLAIVAAAVIVHRTVYYPRCRVNVHQYHLECQEGIWWRRRYFARHDNVKRVELTRYPGGDVGTVRFVVAGERRQGGSSGAPGMSGQNNLEGMGATSYGFGVRYAEDIARHRLSLDERLQGFEPEPDHEEVTPEHESRPALANSLTPLIVLSVVIIPLVVLLPVTVPLTVMAIRRRSYRVEPRRVLLKSGILYRRQASILHDRIDSIRRNQNLLGKVFGNGNVTIFTAGSSRPDMELSNAPDYEQLFVVLKSHYQD